MEEANYTVFRYLGADLIAKSAKTGVETTSTPFFRPP